MPTLEISVLGARNFKRADPYILATSGTQSYKTVVRKKSNSPNWSEIFRFEVYPASSQTVRIALMDKCIVNDDEIGFYELGLNGFTLGQVTTQWVQLQCKKEGGVEVELRTLPVDFGATPPPGAPVFNTLQDYVSQPHYAQQPQYAQKPQQQQYVQPQRPQVQYAPVPPPPQQYYSPQQAPVQYMQPQNYLPPQQYQPAYAPPPPQSLYAPPPPPQQAYGYAPQGQYGYAPPQGYAPPPSGYY